MAGKARQRLVHEKETIFCRRRCRRRLVVCFVFTAKISFYFFTKAATVARLATFSTKVNYSEEAKN